MTLTAGTRLGPYQILSAIGAGGMGEVYRASDERLGREVAVKVLPAGFSADPDRLKRFALEARAASALNHPNILTIFDIGTADGSPYLVSELLEGSTLREMLRQQQQIPMRKALEISVQIANGLSAAHEKGIVHRDLKPENVFILKGGRVKILDFGLAKLIERSASSGSGKSVTMPTGTDPGTVLGTAGYMSPEQVRGNATDARSDIFSFGAILYEMLTGQRAFKGDSSADISSAILKEDPPEITSANPHVSPALDRIVQHSLEKDAADRFQSAKDLAFALQSVSTVSESALRAAPAPTSSNWKRNALWGALALLLAAATLAWMHSSKPTQNVSKVVRSERLTDFVGLQQFPAISPDGKSVAFISDTGGKRQLWVRLLRGGVPLQITRDPVDHLYPRWSRDSASIIYYTPPATNQAQGMLWEVSALGGFPHQLANSVSGADVSHDGNKLAFFRLADGLVELVSTDRDGSNPHSVLRSPPNSEQPNFDFLFPRWSPDDKSIAYQRASAMWADDIYLVSSSGGDPRQLTHESKLMGGLAWTGDGAIIYSSARGGTVLYLPTLQLWMVRPEGGEPQQLTFEDVVYENPDVVGAQIVASRRSMKIDIWKFPVGPDPVKNVRQGERLTEQSGGVFTPTVSPDDSEIAFLSDSGGHGNIWVKNLRNGDLRQITFEQDPRNTVGTPVWSPRGQQIAFATTHNLNTWSNIGYSVVDSDGSNLHILVLSGAWAAWSGDAQYLYYAEALPTSGRKSLRLMKISARGGEPSVVLTDGGTASAPSYDGSALYYILPLAKLTGGLDFDIRVARPEGAPSKTLVRISSNRVPQWQGLHPTLSHDDKWLALPMNDAYGTNIWLISTADGKLRQLTDFGERRTFIVRRVSWSSDDKFIFAAVGEGQADIVILEGMLESSPNQPRSR
jgi:eukaryotic-like serine/threonine-protein kinase